MCPRKKNDVVRLYLVYKQKEGEYIQLVIVFGNFLFELKNKRVRQCCKVLKKSINLTLEKSGDLSDNSYI